MTKFKMTPIKLKGKLADPKAYARAVENTLNASALAAKADFGTTTQTWSKKNKPTFKIESKPGERIVATDSQIYEWVDEGTPAHDIKPKGGGRLFFRRGYRAKTRPGYIGSGSGGSFGGLVSTRKTIKHPGTAARGFSDEIQKKWDKELPVTMQRAINAEKE